MDGVVDCAGRICPPSAAMSIALMALPLQAELAVLAHATQLGISDVSTATLWPTHKRGPYCHYYLRCLCMSWRAFLVYS